jgi:DNA-binding PadR family transcriptional regulator
MALRYAIMTALIDDELSGYDLAGSFDQSLGFFWHASHQQIYRELAKLTELAWVTRRPETQQGRPDRILYALTDKGREALETWVLGEDRMRLQETKDELYIKLYNLSASNIDYLRTRLLERREAMMRRLYLYERIRRRHYADPASLPLRRKGVYLALSGGITGGQHYLAWCDEALELLAQVNDEECAGREISPAATDTA